MALRLVTASVVVEWYNMTHAELGRAARMLSAVTGQAASLCEADEQARVRLARPLDLVIACDSKDRSSLQHARSTLSGLTHAGAVVPRLLPVADSRYCSLKNAGAAASSGEIIIFLDSDVIPEPNWLAAFLEALADSRVSVVVGNTYVDCAGQSAYAKAMALTWMFPLRDPHDRVTPSTWFYANNVAFRREPFLCRKFPDVPGLTHAPAKLLVERLEHDGVAIWHAGGARASHPPPNGSIHFVLRAIAGGRARAFLETHRKAVHVMRWIQSDLESVAWGCKRIVRNGSSVGLRWWQVPLAIMFPAAYYSLRCLGSLLSTLTPGLMRNRFDL